ncbi:leucine-rich repeat domain-containing protein [Winogradskyella sp. PC D3.3]
MDFKIEHLTTYFKDLKTSHHYPEAFLYEMFLIGKLTRDKTIISEISETLKKHGTEAINNAFNTQNKLPEKANDAAKVINVLLHFGSIDPLFPIGKLYAMLEFSSLSINEEAMAKKLEEQPHLISRLNGIIRLRIKDVFTNEIPDEISDITSLTSLEIEGKYKQLPNTIGHLQQLESLCLELPQLAHFPESFWTLNKIKQLELSNINTDFQDSLQLEKLKKLETLDFFELNLKDASELQLPTSLKELSFIRLENLTNLPKAIARLKNLEKFNIFKCPKLLNLPTGLNQLNKLFVIKLKTVPLIKTIEDHQIFTPNCEYITLDDHIQIVPGTLPISNSELLIRDVKILNYVLSHSENFVNLKKLKIHYITDFSDVSVGLGQLPLLESIDIHQGSQIKTLFENIEKCTQLNYLKLYDVNIETFPNGLKNLNHLEYLSFNSCRELVLNGTHLPRKIKELQLFAIKEYVAAEKRLETEHAYFGNLTIEAPKVLFSNLITKTLHFSGINECQNTEDDLTQYLPKPKALTTLKAYTNIGHFKHVLQYCTNLEYLHLDNNEASTAALSCYPAPQLNYLKLDFYKAKNLEELIGNMPNLETLDIAHYEVTKVFPKVSLPYLKTLDLSYTTFATLENLEAPQLNKLRIALSYEFGKEAYSKLSQFKALKKLELLGIGDDVNTIPENITELKLTEFLIGHNYEDLPEFLKRITTLETLALGGNNFKDLPTWIADLPKLTRLDIDGCKFENPVPAYFRKLKLKELKYYLSGFSGFNMNPEKYKYLITPGYTQLMKEFSKQDTD